jgi:hypothetical protein
VLKPPQQGKFRDEDGPQCEPPGVDQALGWHLGMTIEDTFELLVEVLNGHGARLMKDAMDLLSGTSVMIQY